MRRILTVVVIISIAWVGIELVQAQAGDKGPVYRRASELKWVDAPGVQGVQQAAGWGDAAKGPHGSFAKFAGGAETPLHTHTSAGRSVVVAGTIISTADGQKPVELAAGSYFALPAGVKHTTACKAGAECIIFSQWLGPFDLKPAEPGAKK